MLSRFSVKKPYIVTVAVIIILILGGVSLTKMKTDLLPDMDLPYLAVITTDPGASAEKVESEVTDVLEGSLSKVSGVSSVQSQSADNYSMIFLEFEDGSDMDSAMVKVSSAVNEVSSQLPETAGSPNYMEISMDMMATLYVAASYDDHDIFDTTSLVKDKAVPELERIDGVADITEVDNVGDQYMRINAKDGVLLSVFKNSTASTSEVSADTRAALTKIEQANPGLHLTVVSDPGSFIALYINSILQSLLLGALLAVVVLIVFLRDWRPTLIMAFSIPFSVLCALGVMYFHRYWHAGR